MKIKMLNDQTRGAAGGYEERASVSLHLTPGEARDLRVALGDLLDTKDADDPAWHTHVHAWDDASEIILMLDQEGAHREPAPEDHLNRWLSDLATSGGSVVRAVNAVAETHQVDVVRAKELLREHPDWKQRL